MPGNKVSIEKRIEAAKRCSEGKICKSEAARRLNVHESTIDEWVLLYNEKGAEDFNLWNIWNITKHIRKN